MIKYSIKVWDEKKNHVMKLAKDDEISLVSNYDVIRQKLFSDIDNLNKYLILYLQIKTKYLIYGFNFYLNNDIAVCKQYFYKSAKAYQLASKINEINGESRQSNELKGAEDYPYICYLIADAYECLDEFEKQNNLYYFMYKKDYENAQVVLDTWKDSDWKIILQAVIDCDEDKFVQTVIERLKDLRKVAKTSLTIIDIYALSAIKLASLRGMDVSNIDYAELPQSLIQIKKQDFSDIVLEVPDRLKEMLVQ